MKTIVRQSKRRAAFTIVELLTVMSIIVILIGLLVPALNKVRIYAKEVTQSAQFHSMDAAIELFNNAFDGYPESSALDPMRTNYCGAMKLCEAMMGQDLLGFHSNSIFNADGTDAMGVPCYDPADLSARKGPFLPADSANAFIMSDIYGSSIGPFGATNFVLCDVFTRRLATGVKAGMPILYYKANPANAIHRYDVKKNIHMPIDTENSDGNIYNYFDNHALVGLGKPWETGGTSHKLFEDPLASPPEAPGVRFYINTKNAQIARPWRPYRADSYILISAGYDGEYGTADDICNYNWKYMNAEPAP